MLFHDFAGNTSLGIRDSRPELRVRHLISFNGVDGMFTAVGTRKRGFIERYPRANMVLPLAFCLCVSALTKGG